MIENNNWDISEGVSGVVTPVDVLEFVVGYMAE